MLFNSPENAHLPITTFTNSTSSRPNIIFNYIAPKSNPLATPNISNTHSQPKTLTPLLSKLQDQTKDIMMLMNKFSQQTKPLSHRDPKRKKIFVKSQSINDMFTLSRANSLQNRHNSVENRQASQGNQVKSRRSRKRNFIFQSYNPKSRLTTSNNYSSPKGSAKATHLHFERPVHPKNLTNYLQLTPNRIGKTVQEQMPYVRINTQSYINKIPLRNTYVAERDWQSTAKAQKQKESSDILQKELYEIPLHKMEESFTKKIEPEDLVTRLKPNGFHNLQFEPESINGYSNRQVHAHYDHIDDLPQLFLETNDNKVLARTEKNEKNKFKSQSSSLVDIKVLQSSDNTDKSLTFTKEIVTKNNQSLVKNTHFSLKKASIEGLPYLLVVLGVLLLVIQIFK